MAEKTQGISGVAIGAAFVGGLFLWSGIKGYRMSYLVQDILSGKDPQKDPRVRSSQLSVTPGGLLGSLNPIHLLSSGGSAVASTGGSVSGTKAQNKALGQRMAAAVGWTGSQWTAFNNIIMSESGWSATIKNPNSDASGIGQNINGFGPGYEYGNAAQQIAWTIHYIQQRYGTPEKAWAFHLAHGWY